MTTQTPFPSTDIPAELNALAGLLEMAAGRLRTLAAPVPMTRICSWCCRVMCKGTLPATHGICQSCSDQLFIEAK